MSIVSWQGIEWKRQSGKRLTPFIQGLFEGERNKNLRARLRDESSSEFLFYFDYCTRPDVQDKYNSFAAYTYTPNKDALSAAKQDFVEAVKAMHVLRHSVGPDGSGPIPGEEPEPEGMWQRVKGVFGRIGSQDENQYKSYDDPKGYYEGLVRKWVPLGGGLIYSAAMATQGAFVMPVLPGSQQASLVLKVVDAVRAPADPKAKVKYFLEQADATVLGALQRLIAVRSPMLLALGILGAEVFRNLLAANKFSDMFAPTSADNIHNVNHIITTVHNQTGYSTAIDVDPAELVEIVCRRLNKTCAAQECLQFPWVNFTSIGGERTYYFLVMAPEWTGANGGQRLPGVVFDFKTEAPTLSSSAAFTYQCRLTDFEWLWDERFTLPLFCAMIYPVLRHATPFYFSRGGEIIQITGDSQRKVDPKDLPKAVTTKEALLFLQQGTFDAQTAIVEYWVTQSKVSWADDTLEWKSGSCISDTTIDTTDTVAEASALSFSVTPLCMLTQDTHGIEVVKAHIDTVIGAVNHLCASMQTLISTKSSSSSSSSSAATINKSALDPLIVLVSSPHKIVKEMAAHNKELDATVYKYALINLTTGLFSKTAEAAEFACTQDGLFYLQEVGNPLSFSRRQGYDKLGAARKPNAEMTARFKAIMGEKKITAAVFRVIGLLLALSAFKQVTDADIAATKSKKIEEAVRLRMRSQLGGFEDGQRMIQDSLVLLFA